jgi:REP element-mobilizing transposase RayT
MTFHLADSLPTQKLTALREEKKLWLALHPPPLDGNQLKEYHRNFTQRVHEWLDAGHGSYVLARSEIFGLVESVLNFFDGQRYELGKYVVMPNHVHALVTPLADHDLHHILHSWKSFSANQINKSSGSHSRVWHPESFDHIVRSPEQLARIEQYIQDNPKFLPMNKGANLK